MTKRQERTAESSGERKKANLALHCFQLFRDKPGPLYVLCVGVPYAVYKTYSRTGVNGTLKCPACCTRLGGAWAPRSADRGHTRLVARSTTLECVVRIGIAKCVLGRGCAARTEKRKPECFTSGDYFFFYYQQRQAAGRVIPHRRAIFSAKTAL